MTRPSAAQALAKALAAFEASDFNAAAAFATAAQEQILEQIGITGRAREGCPLYSIIILAQRHSADLENLIGQVKPHLSRDFELLLVLNGAGAEPFFPLQDDVTVVHVGFNYGCAGGRNIGARLARGKFLIFLDDDGVLGDAAIDRLIDVIQCYDAVAVRGRILPRTEGALTPRHYDCGDDIIYSTLDTEGLSIWRREEFLHFGGFDTLLAGHEGVALWSKMFRFYGPESFLYAPSAVLYHDYAKTESHHVAKKRQQNFNLTYLDHAYPMAVALKSALNKHRKETRTRILFARSRYTAKKYIPEAPRVVPGVSVLTVANTAGHLLDDYTHALKRQTFTDFEIIFVDQGSIDDTADRLAALWQGDARLRLLKSGGSRAECFNLALSEAAHDICVVAEARDISLPNRLELTVRYFLASPSGCMSFAAFSAEELFKDATKPPSACLRASSLFGPAPSIRVLSFRKKHFIVPFDVSLSIGCEAKWLRDNFTCGSADGAALPLHQVFHGRDDATTDAELDAARDVELAALYAAHEQLLGKMSEEDLWCCRVAAEFETLASDRLPALQTYALRLITSNAEKELYDQVQLDACVSACLSRLESRTAKLRGDELKRRLEALRKEHEGRSGDFKSVTERD